MENKFIILIPIGNSVQPAWFDGDNKPLLFETEEEAKKYHEDDFGETRERQLEEVESGDRQPDEVDTEPEDYVSSCTIDENGCIRTPDDGLVYDPQTFKR